MEELFVPISVFRQIIGDARRQAEEMLLAEKASLVGKKVRIREKTFVVQSIIASPVASPTAIFFMSAGGTQVLVDIEKENIMVLT